MVETLLDVQNLSIYTQKPIVENLTFTLCAGEMLAVIGRSGSGKTLMMTSFLGLNEPIKITGNIYLQKTKLPIHSTQTKDWQQIRGKKIAYIFQDPKQTLNPLHTIKKAFWVIFKQIQVPRRQRLEYIHQLLAQVGLFVPLNRYPHQLSGGEAQRLAIALALAFNPVLIIADEPTSSLDDKHSQDILTLFQKLANDGRTVVIISHQTQYLQNFHQILWLKDNTFILGNYNYILQQLPQIDFGLPSSWRNDNDIVLQIQNLTLGYKKPWQGRQPPIIQNFSLNIQHQQIVGLAGNSGAGKSSIAKAITRLDDDLWIQGDIFLLQDKRYICLTKLSKQKISVYRPKIIWVMQDITDSLNPNLLIYHSIFESFFAKNLPFEREELDEFFDLLGLSKTVLWRYPHQLSGGEQSRVVLLRALFSKPSLLILDEPTAMLDNQTTFQVINLLKTINQKLKIAMLIISHDTKMLTAMCHKIVYI